MLLLRLTGCHLTSLNTLSLVCNCLALMGVLERLNACFTWVYWSSHKVMYCCMGTLKQCCSLLQRTLCIKIMKIKKLACTINDTSMVKMFAHLNCLYIHCTIKLYHHIIINLLYIHIIHVQSICEGINYKILSC